MGSKKGRLKPPTSGRPAIPGLVRVQVLITEEQAAHLAKKGERSAAIRALIDADMATEASGESLLRCG